MLGCPQTSGHAVYFQLKQLTHCPLFTSFFHFSSSGLLNLFAFLPTCLCSNFFSSSAALYLISLIHPPTPPLSIPLSLSLLYCPGAHGGLLQQIILHNNMEGLHNKLHLFRAVKGAAIKIVVSLPSVMRAQLTAPWTF